MDVYLLFPTYNNDNYPKTKFKIIKRANQLRRMFISNEVLIDFPNHKSNTAKKALEYFVENSYVFQRAESIWGIIRMWEWMSNDKTCVIFKMSVLDNEWGVLLI